MRKSYNFFIIQLLSVISFVSYCFCLLGQRKTQVAFLTDVFAFILRFISKVFYKISIKNIRFNYIGLPHL